MMPMNRRLHEWHAVCTPSHNPHNPSSLLHALRRLRDVAPSARPIRWFFLTEPIPTPRWPQNSWQSSSRRCLTPMFRPLHPPTRLLLCRSLLKQLPTRSLACRRSWHPTETDGHGSYSATRQTVLLRHAYCGNSSNCSSTADYPRIYGNSFPQPS